jgi:co-chaperonin GroES (HSP10)
MKVIPVRDNILVEFLIDKGKGIIEIPDEHRQTSRRAKILDVGPEEKSYKKDEIVLLSWYSGIDIDIPGAPYSREVKLIRGEQIIARVEE